MTTNDVTLYPYGYGRTVLTEARLISLIEPHMHPGFFRRVIPWLQSMNGLIGVGGARRVYQPNLPGFAPAGESFHQDQKFASRRIAYTALDLVARVPGGDHRSPTWDEVPRQNTAEAARWGIHANVPREPWHVQPVEIDGYAQWIGNGRPDPAMDYPLPGDVPADVWPPMTRPDVANGEWGLYPLDGNKPVLRVTSPRTRSQHAGYAQAVLRLKCGLVGVDIDDIYGPGTEQAVRMVQRWNDLTPDGIIGPLTWRVIDSYAVR